MQRQGKLFDAKITHLHRNCMASNMASNMARFMRKSLSTSAPKLKISIDLIRNYISHWWHIDTCGIEEEEEEEEEEERLSCTFFNLLIK